MRSMTGYGRFRLEENGREMTVEIKTVNHRFLDFNPRTPRSLLFLEDTLRAGVSARISRGHADVFLTYVNHREDAREVRVDTALLHAYQQAYDELAAASLRDDRTVSTMASLPEVLQVVEQEEDIPAVTALCQHTLDGAIDMLETMRLREGKNLSEDLLGKIDTLEGIVARIAERAPHVVEDYRDKLNARIAEILEAPADPVRIAQEVALFADRAAIDEELVRLGSHFTQLRAALRSDEPVGRKLDFLVQELNREINTIGSKASDLAITQCVVEAKGEIEKIREQVQNVE